MCGEYITPCNYGARGVNATNGNGLYVCDKCLSACESLELKHEHKDAKHGYATTIAITVKADDINAAIASLAASLHNSMQVADKAETTAVIMFPEYGNLCGLKSMLNTFDRLRDVYGVLSVEQVASVTRNDRDGLNAVVIPAQLEDGTRRVCTAIASVTERAEIELVNGGITATISHKDARTTYTAIEFLREIADSLIQWLVLSDSPNRAECLARALQRKADALVNGELNCQKPSRNNTTGDKIRVIARGLRDGSMSATQAAELLEALNIK